MICGKCGEKIPDEVLFCTNCGARCVKEVCKVCGAEHKEGQLFCPVCGVNLESGTSPAEEPLIIQSAIRQAEEPLVTQSVIRQKEQVSGVDIPAGGGKDRVNKFSHIMQIMRIVVNAFCLVYLVDARLFVEMHCRRSYIYVPPWGGFLGELSYTYMCHICGNCIYFLSPL